MGISLLTISSGLAWEGGEGKDKARFQLGLPRAPRGKAGLWEETSLLGQRGPVLWGWGQGDAACPSSAFLRFYGKA